MQFGERDNGSHCTFYQNAVHYNERENAFMKRNYKCGIFSLVFVIKLGGGRGGGGI